MDEARKPTGKISLSQIMGFLFFCLNIPQPKGRSWVVPTKQNQPHPMRPKSGEIRIKPDQINTTMLTTPQYMECQTNPKLNHRKKAGVSSRKRIRLTVFQKESFFNMTKDLGDSSESEIRQEKLHLEMNGKKACELVCGGCEPDDESCGLVRSPPIPGFFRSKLHC